MHSLITASGAGVFGHPFGRVPVSRPFDANQKEAEIILSDPANPVGKDLIAGELRGHTALPTTSQELLTQ